jgi:DNA-binding transcriptional regulator of glucitol operon
MDRFIPNAYLLFVRYENEFVTDSPRRDKPDRAQDIMPYQTP